MPSVKANPELDGIRSVPTPHCRCRQQIAKSAEIRHRGNNGDTYLACRLIETLQRFRYTQLLGSDIDVVDTRAQLGTDNGFGCVNKWAGAINNGVGSPQCNIQ